MLSKFVSRKQYDLLVKHCPDWMVSVWQEFGRTWTINGVVVRAKEFQIENLKEKLAYVAQCQIA